MSFVLTQMETVRKVLEHRWVRDQNGDLRCRGCDSLADDSWERNEDANCPLSCPWWQLQEDLTEAE